MSTNLRQRAEGWEKKFGRIVLHLWVTFGVLATMNGPLRHKMKCARVFFRSVQYRQLLLMQYFNPLWSWVSWYMSPYLSHWPWLLHCCPSPTWLEPGGPTESSRPFEAAEKEDDLRTTCKHAWKTDSNRQMRTTIDKINDPDLNLQACNAYYFPLLLLLQSFHLSFTPVYLYSGCLG